MNRGRYLYAGSDATVVADYSLSPERGARDALSYTAGRAGHPQDYLHYAPFEHLEPAFRSVGAAWRAHEASRSAARVFLSLYGEQLVPPAVTTTPDGGIQLEWFRRGTGVEILFDADGEIFVLVDREGVVESELAGGLRDPFLLQTLPLIRHD